MQTQKTENQSMHIGKPIKVVYKNWKGEVAERTIIPKQIFYGSTEWHQQEQWLLEVFDVDRNATRVYALCDIKEWHF